jgi:uncharacterized protein YdaU (DUF1376 family)
MAVDKLLAEWFWIDRWMGSSAFLLPIEPRGLYREMLTQAWRRGAWLPNDHAAIQRAVGVTVREWGRTWPVVERYWTVEGDRLFNQTQVEVYAEAKARVERASKRGIKGAKARAQALLKHTPSTTQAVLEVKPPISDLRSPVQRDRSRAPSAGGGAAPLLRFPRFAIWRWQIEDLMEKLGPANRDFDLDGWFATLSARAEAEALVLDHPWDWIKAETMREARRRGLHMAEAGDDRKPMYGGSTADLARGVAEAMGIDPRKAGIPK